MPLTQNMIFRGQKHAYVYYQKTVSGEEKPQSIKRSNFPSNLPARINEWVHARANTASERAH